MSLAQIWVAFGHGAQNMHVAASAVRAVEKVQDAVRRVQASSSQRAHSLEVLEYARALGRTAASVASAQGAPRIASGHIRQAFNLMEKYHSGGYEVWVKCPACPIPARGSKL